MLSDRTLNRTSDHCFCGYNRLAERKSETYSSVWSRSGKKKKKQPITGNWEPELSGTVYNDHTHVDVVWHWKGRGDCNPLLIIREKNPDCKRSVHVGTGGHINLETYGDCTSSSKGMSLPTWWPISWSLDHWQWSRSHTTQTESIAWCVQVPVYLSTVTAPPRVHAYTNTGAKKLGPDPWPKRQRQRAVLEAVPQYMERKHSLGDK